MLRERIGKIDTHSHLLPGLDDGCSSLMESIDCARALAESGYTHSFVTPHIWPSYPHNNLTEIPKSTAALQRELDLRGIRLKLFPGGEINLRADYHLTTPPEEVVTYGLSRKHVLIDLWCDELPQFFAPAVRWFKSLGLTVVLAHPERMRAVQLGPGIADYFARLGVLMQGNLQCLSDPKGKPTRTVAERYLKEGRYFMLGTDLHNLDSLPSRLQGLRVAERIVGSAKLRTLTQKNPMTLLQPPANS